MTYEEASVLVRGHYDAGERNIALPRDLYDAYQSGLLPCIRFRSTSCKDEEHVMFKDAIVRPVSEAA